MRIRPGNGWKFLGGGVWQNESGTRVHVAGIIRLSNGKIFSANRMPQYFEAEKYIKQNGGNRKRGLMVWARILEFDQILADQLESPVRPLFVPLRSEYYDAFADGSKREELRLYGPRWNERTCAVGRGVILSKGYGKKNRMTGRIWKFKRQHGTTFGSTYKEAILACYGTLDIWIACFSVDDLAQAS